MKPIQPGRQTYNGDWGQSRVFISSNESSLHFEPGEKGVTLAWSTAEPALPTLHSLLEQEIKAGEPQDGIIFFRPVKHYHKRDWRRIWNKFSEAVSDNPHSIEFVRFDFAGRSIALTSVLPHFTLGIGYNIRRRNGERPQPFEVHALRNAFLATAEPSVKPELDWAIESIIPK